MSVNAYHAQVQYFKRQSLKVSETETKITQTKCRVVKMNACLWLCTQFDKAAMLRQYSPNFLELFLTTNGS